MSSAFETTGVGVAGETRFDGLRALAQSLLVAAEPEADADPPSAEDAGTTLVLRLDDLVSDPSGEIVLSVGSVGRHVVLESASEVADRGVTGPHTTVGGENVQGMGYVLFHDGPTLYFPLDVQLTIGPSGV
mgnify:CR=1 FL=1